MRDLWHFLELLFIFGDLGLKIPANAEMIPKKMPELPSDLIYDAESHKFKLLPSREEMAERLTDGSERQKAIFFQLYDSALGEFDVKGYKWLMDSAPGLQMAAMMSLMMVKGLVQSVAGTVIDIVPPLIPPPVWINQ
ncbi:hypothetical protein, conserved [Eimeria tenella]|uniref:Uncharacterized protein n=1 Tax=Eimeria tenella TaxID=5802 RepID=U6L5W5_EIMTE|nr:hypothetical protein, conserved [Eimeria tenella]CDJ45541.1 hypothetical protein, conserved [Eimeria tenella]|eukprot:XP_013236287.1 hypothetical protein, conserved [Eimeria tenella]